VVPTTIDVSFDFRVDTPPGKDPDTYSPTLAGYHRQLWSKPLPNGASFDLVASAPPVCLHHRSIVGEFWLSSDSVIHTYTQWASMQPIIDQLPAADSEEFRTIACTIGAMMIWPANRVDGKLTINGARGFNRSISERFDLTVECVRRYYLGVSPLGPTFGRYPEFFALFVDFRGFVEFFLLQDIVTNGHSRVRFFMPFDDFKLPAVPRDVPTYLAYRRSSIDFVQSRNRRIARLDVGRSTEGIRSNRSRSATPQ
jgi:hypothetical protein